MPSTRRASSIPPAPPPGRCFAANWNGSVEDNATVAATFSSSAWPGWSFSRIEGYLPAVCSDPVALNINVSLVSRTSPTSGRVAITGVVKNIGQADYTSRPNLQGASLYEDGCVAAYLPFTSIAAGQQVSLSYQRSWTVDPSIEFPPSYRLVVSYSPDITLDGDLRNDDCNRTNNEMSRSFVDLNQPFN